MWTENWHGLLGTRKVSTWGIPHFRSIISVKIVSSPE